MKINIFGVQARDRLIKGANYLADTVKLTFGSFGQNALLEKGLRVTNDGKSIAAEMQMEDEIEDLGLRFLREATTKTDSQVGDGTTGATILAQAIMKESLKLLPKEGVMGKMTPIEVINKIEKEKKEVIEKLQAMATPVETKEALIASALVSVEDQELAELIGGTQWELGKDGIILSEETPERTHSVERVKGIRIDNGFGTTNIITNQEKQQLEATDCKVILTNATFIDFTGLVNILTQLQKIGVRKIAIVARAFSSQAIQVCMDNIKNGMMLYPINAPYTNQSEIMKDLASVLGGRYIDTEETNLEDMQLTDVGFAKKIVARRMDAIITGEEDPAKRIEELTQQLEGALSDFEKRGLKARIAQLTNGTAILKVGCTSDAERKYKKDKAEDACNAVRLAFQEGVVKGAGQALKEIADTLPNDYILKNAIQAPYNQIKSTCPPDYEIPDWVKDPVKVIRVSLENACSVAGTLATAGIAIANSKPKELDTLLRNTLNQE